MWYYSPPEQQPEQMSPNEIVATFEPYPGAAAADDVASGEHCTPLDSVGAPKLSAASAGPGSEYWLP